MKIGILALLIIPALAQADSCSCNLYPFTPNPPCFNECVQKLVTNKSINLQLIKGLDPGVAANIDALRKNKFIVHEFDGINNKRSLEAAAAERVFMRDDL